MKFTFALLAVLSIGVIGTWSAATNQEAEIMAEERQGFSLGGDLFSSYFNDCSRQFCPTYKHRCCCEGAFMGSKFCCEVRTNGEPCSLYTCRDGYWQCAQGC
ncbi:hypothetical protein TCAL_15306 [Tigriopus californicus]|uniref:Granulins domain-containing protein n=1 Tax=Tigriopus californicus TaxID=6832 RepID=A0A553PMG8_TIGCA|nr:hypothetical protein TCAL_15306 [Tigriopus californicus]